MIFTSPAGGSANCELRSPVSLKRIPKAFSLSASTGERLGVRCRFALGSASGSRRTPRATGTPAPPRPSSRAATCPARRRVAPMSTPYRARTGNGRRNCTFSFSEASVRPSGLQWSLPSLAIDLLAAISMVALIPFRTESGASVFASGVVTGTRNDRRPPSDRADVSSYASSMAWVQSPPRLGNHLHDVPRLLSVMIHPGPHKDALWTRPVRHGTGHG